MGAGTTLGHHLLRMLVAPGRRRFEQHLGELESVQRARLNRWLSAAARSPEGLRRGVRADCVLKLPPPTGLIALDSKFPLENYQRMFASELADADRTQAHRQFRADVRKHVDDIACPVVDQRVHAHHMVKAAMFSRQHVTC